ncbi:hypothetical protein ACQE3E_22000 [Methylomonas sp. MED-D]|uniref:DUF5666 domain-containing protein n=1 Tax=Methylomonas koyamae TaxID=702114 RepID=A0A177NMB4_9GAMM|nr:MULTISPECIES: hypothetical protein [Methylomonas]MDT4331883.1 hypothetical protein [Methylomonas sp. MV1]OAI19228.1 hypothetical protein A1355_04600 [Methylomonas koyamae]
MKLIFIVFLLLSSNAYSKYPIESFQNVMNRVVTQSDTIFIGKVLNEKTIEKGLVVGLGTKQIGILEVEVIKKYKGHVVKNEKRLVCTWFDNTEHLFNFKIGQELTFFGIDTGLNIQLPSTYGYIRSSSGIEKELSKSLKLRSKPNKDRNMIFEIVDSDSKVTRNACNEPDAWELATEYRPTTK